MPHLERAADLKFGKLDLLQLPNYRVYIKLMIDGTPSVPFSAATLGPHKSPFRTSCPIGCQILPK
jgi:hypothetical protein